MSNFAIFRVERIKSVQQLGAAQSHNKRLAADTPNADPSIKNRTLVDRGDIVQLWHNIIDANQIKVRKNAVLALETVQTFSPDADVKDLDAWARDSMRFLEKKFGKENILHAELHLDETTPHIQAIIIPLKDGKLNAKAMASGKKMMSDMQTEYAKSVEGHGLERGILNSKATHKTIKEYYSELNADAKKIKEIKKEIASELKELNNVSAINIPRKISLISNISLGLERLVKSFLDKERNLLDIFDSLKMRNQNLSKKLSKTRSDAKRLHELWQEAKTSQNALQSENEALREQVSEYKYSNNSQIAEKDDLIAKKDLIIEHLNKKNSHLERELDKFGTKLPSQER